MDDILNLDIDIGFDTLSLGNDAKDSEDPNAGKSVQVKKTVNQHAMRRVLSELALEKELPWHFEKGVSYHCISFGDVDALTYFRVVVKQQRIKYALISTWCCSSTDIAEVRAWIIVNKVDKKLERGEKFRFKIIRGKKIDSRMRTIRIVKSVNILKQGNL